MKTKKKASKYRKIKGGNTENDDDEMGGLNQPEGAQTSSKTRVRYVESKHVKACRENFERMEKQAMRSSKAYR